MDEFLWAIIDLISCGNQLLYPSNTIYAGVAVAYLEFKNPGKRASLKVKKDPSA